MNGIKPARERKPVQSGVSRLPSSTTFPARTSQGDPPALASTPAAALARSGTSDSAESPLPAPPPRCCRSAWRQRYRAVAPPHAAPFQRPVERAQPRPDRSGGRTTDGPLPSPPTGVQYHAGAGRRRPGPRQRGIQIPITMGPTPPAPPEPPGPGRRGRHRPAVRRRLGGPDRPPARGRTGKREAAGAAGRHQRLAPGRSAIARRPVRGHRSLPAARTVAIPPSGVHGWAAGIQPMIPWLTGGIGGVGHDEREGDARRDRARWPAGR